MIKDKAMKLALEALLAATPVKAKDPQMQAVAIVALQEALAEPQQEPVATGDTLFRQFMSEAEKAGVTHWPTPPSAQTAPVQEPKTQSLKDAVFTVLEGFTLPHDVRKILEAAYYTTRSTAALGRADR